MLTLHETRTTLESTNYLTGFQLAICKLRTTIKAQIYKFLIGVEKTITASRKV
jgi:hypothetical protein